MAQQNGVAEHVHQTIMNLVRVNLHTATLPNRLWWYAALHAVYIYNCTPCAPLKYKTPYFICYSTEANLDKILSILLKMLILCEAIIKLIECIKISSVPITGMS